MDFSFNYNVAGTMAKIMITIEDVVVAEAKQVGIEMKDIEGELKTAIDGFVDRVTSIPSLVKRAVSKMEAIAKDVEAEVEVVVQDVEAKVKSVIAEVKNL